MKSAVLFCNGEIHDYHLHCSYFGTNDMIIAVDGGIKHCMQLDIKPDIVIGDFDSIDDDGNKYLESLDCKRIEYPTDKDYIDLALAIEEAIKCGCDRVLILGALGGKRIDMEIANIMLLSRYSVNIVIKNEFSDIICLNGYSKYKLMDSEGLTLSIIPLSDQVEFGFSEGLKYPLNSIKLNLGESRGVSNFVTSNHALLSITSGKALIILQK